MFNGLELEADFLRVLVESSRNPKVQPGSPGYFDCSQFVEVIDKPAIVDRSMGEVYPLGNPHYHFSPKNVLRVAEGITEILYRLDQANENSYRKNFASFQDRFNEYRKQWSGKPLTGKKFLPYHKFFEYLADEFGFEILGYIEPKPGIPPSAGYLEKLIEMIKRTKPDAILTTVYYGEKEVKFLSQKTGIKYLVLPHDVGAMTMAKDWFSFMEQVLDALK
jgi:zinc/manganese transport system substrate-binding protein